MGKKYMIKFKSNMISLVFIFLLHSIIFPVKLFAKSTPNHYVQGQEMRSFPAMINASIYSIVAVSIIIILIGFVAFLGANTIKRKNAEEELLVSNQKLQITNGRLIVANKELHSALERISDQDKKIYDLVCKDTLTGMSNRFTITQQVNSILGGSRDVKNMALLLLDIDNFKFINDKYGHVIGDRIIREIAKKLEGQQCEHIQVSRFGGDEFLFIYENYNDEKELLDFMDVLNANFFDDVVVDDVSVGVRFSIGISLYPDQGHTCEELIKNADIAMHVAKDQGKNRYVFYNTKLLDDLHNELFVRNAIRKAMKNKDFYLHYQPYLDVASSEVIGFEALIRWDGCDTGKLSPYDLITAAEKMAVINEIGEWVLREACTFARRINVGKIKPIKVSINISPRQIEHKDFYERTMKIIKDTKVNTKHICFEVTETILVKSIKNGSRIIERLKEAGIETAIDDFGTGYSSLKYFKDLPASILKIDKTFVDNILTSQYDLELVTLITKLAHQKDMTVIAEGVEKIEQLEVLRDIRCDIIQGWINSEALSEVAAVEYLEYA